MWKRPASIIRRTFRVGPKTFTGPILDSRRCEGAVKRMVWPDGARPGVARLRRRKLGVRFPLAWNRGNPTGAPPRSPCRDVEKFSRARAASTEAHSKTSLGSSWRQVKPRLPSSLTGESSVSPFFQALNSLMKEKAAQDSEEVDDSNRAPSS